MSMLCPRCRAPGKGPYPRDFGKSIVIDTRRIPNEVTFQGKRMRNATKLRTRACLGCNFEWKTMEVMYDAFVRRDVRGSSEPTNDR